MNKFHYKTHRNYILKTSEDALKNNTNAKLWCPYFLSKKGKKTLTCSTFIYCTMVIGKSLEPKIASDNHKSPKYV